MELGRLVLVWRGVPWCGGQPDAVAMQSCSWRTCRARTLPGGWGGDPVGDKCRHQGTAATGDRHRARASATNRDEQLLTVDAPRTNGTNRDEQLLAVAAPRRSATNEH